MAAWESFQQEMGICQLNDLISGSFIKLTDLSFRLKLICCGAKP